VPASEIYLAGVHRSAFAPLFAGAAAALGSCARAFAVGRPTRNLNLDHEP
jgi:hypothetical protein